MIQYMKWLKKRMDNQPFCLILDVYKAHIDDEVKRNMQKKNNLNILLRS